MRKVMTATLAAAGGLAIVLISVAPAWAVLPPTTVSPEGDYIKLGLPAGGEIHEGVTFTDTACSTASKPTLPLGTNTTNQIPTAGNPTAAGPVIVPLNRMAMTNCSTTASGFTVTVKNTAGWKLALQHRSTRDTATLRIPKNGSVITATFADGVFTCVGTVAPDGPVSVTGKWTDGSPSKLTITNAPVPAQVTGPSPCPDGPITGFITVTFNVTDVSHPGTPIGVT